MTPNDQAMTLEAFRMLGVSVQDFWAIRQAPFQQAVPMLQDLKDRAKRNYKRLALELHPDRTGNDETKTAQFKFLSQILSDFEKLQVRPPPPTPPPPPPMAWVQVSRTIFRPGMVGTTVNTGAATVQQGQYVVFMRPWPV